MQYMEQKGVYWGLNEAPLAWATPRTDTAAA